MAWLAMLIWDFPWASYNEFALRSSLRAMGAYMPSEQVTLNQAYPGLPQLALESVWGADGFQMKTFLRLAGGATVVLLTISVGVMSM
jgi:hypothetical protein